MRKGILVSEVLRRVLDDTDGEFSSSDDEIVGDVKVGGDQFVWKQPGTRFSARSEFEPCLLDSALLNDDEVGEVCGRISFYFIFVLCELLDNCEAKAL